MRILRNSSFLFHPHQNKHFYPITLHSLGSNSVHGAQQSSEMSERPRGIRKSPRRRFLVIIRERLNDMPSQPLFLFSSLSFITGILVALVIIILVFLIKKKCLYLKPPFKKLSLSFIGSLKHWAVAFLLFNWGRLPTVLISKGFSFSSLDLIPFYVATSVFAAAGYLFLYRGTVILLTKNKFWTDTLPLIIFVIISATYITLNLLTSVPTVIIISIMFIFIIVTVFSVVCMSAIYLSRRFKIFTNILRIGTALLGAGWFAFLVFHSLFLFSILSYSWKYWLVVITNEPFIYLGFTFSYFIILLGFILFSFGLTSLADDKVRK